MTPVNFWVSTPKELSAIECRNGKSFSQTALLKIKDQLPITSVNIENIGSNLGEQTWSVGPLVCQGTGNRY